MADVVSFAALTAAAAEARDKHYYCVACRYWPGSHMQHREAAATIAVLSLLAGDAETLAVALTADRAPEPIMRGMIAVLRDYADRMHDVVPEDYR